MANESTEKINVIKANVKIPSYFGSVIVPQLGSYYSEYEVNFEAKPVVCCPLHDENTPSMRYYEETNTFYCFGCGKGGDILKLHQEFTEKQTGVRPSFEETVEFLYGYFISGRTHLESAHKHKSLIKNSIENSVVDTARFGKYGTELNSKIMLEDGLDIEKKIHLWNTIDNLELLVSMDKITVAEAKSFIGTQLMELFK